MEGKRRGQREQQDRQRGPAHIRNKPGHGEPLLGHLHWNEEGQINDDRVLARIADRIADIEAREQRGNADNGKSACKTKDKADHRRVAKADADKLRVPDRPDSER